MKMLEHSSRAAWLIFQEKDPANRDGATKSYTALAKKNLEDRSRESRLECFLIITHRYDFLLMCERNSKAGAGASLDLNIDRQRICSILCEKLQLPEVILLRRTIKYHRFYLISMLCLRRWLVN